MIIFIIFAAILISIYAINQFSQTEKATQITDNQVYIIKTLNNSENARQVEKISLLNAIKKDLEDRHHEHQRIIDNLTTVMKSLNLTVVVHDNDSVNDTKDIAGKISAFIGSPIEILNSTQ